jgi:hypothetical protein
MAASSAASSMTNLVSITQSAVSPQRGSAMSPKGTGCADPMGYVPEFRQQLCSRVLWTYLILGLVLLAVCFYFYATAMGDKTFYIGTRPDGFPTFLDNPWYIYIVVSIAGVLYVYGMYRAYVACTSEGARNMINIVFAAVVALIIIWFYQFYRKGKTNADNTAHASNGEGNRTPFAIALAIIVLLVVQFFLFWQTNDRLAAYTIIPLLVGIALFAWGSWELGNGVPETF